MAFIDIDSVVHAKNSNSARFSYQWVVELPSLVTNNDIASSALNRYISFLPQAQKGLLKNSLTPVTVSNRVYSIDSPFLSYNAEEYPSQTLNWKYINEVSIPNLELSIEEYEDELTLQYISAWRSLIRNENGTMNPVGVYKKNIIQHRLDNNSRVTGSTTFVDCVPIEVSPVSYSYESDDIVEYKVTFSVDDIIESLPGTTTSGMLGLKSNLNTNSLF